MYLSIPLSIPFIYLRIGIPILMSFDGLRNLLKKSKETTKASPSSSFTTAARAAGEGRSAPSASSSTIAAVPLKPLDPYAATMARLHHPPANAVSESLSLPSSLPVSGTGTTATSTSTSTTTPHDTRTAENSSSSRHSTDHMQSSSPADGALEQERPPTADVISLGGKRARSTGSPATERMEEAARESVPDGVSPPTSFSTRSEFATWRGKVAVALDAALNAVMKPSPHHGHDQNQRSSSSSDGSEAASATPWPAPLQLPLAVRRFLAHCLDHGLAELPEGEMVGMKEAAVLHGLLLLFSPSSPASLGQENPPQKQRQRMEKTDEEWDDVEEEGDITTMLPKEVVSGIASQLVVLQQLADLCHAMWFLLAAQWRAALLGQLAPTQTRDAAGQRVEGWSYPVYRFLLDRTIADDDKAYTAVVLQSIEQWRELARERERAFQLLACVFSDYCRVRRAVRDGVQRSLSNSSASREMIHILSQELSAAAADEACIVPTALRSGLHRLLVVHLQEEGSVVAARQDYTDITQGNANWKLGLFSGGEVHMRRSMERVERNRIYHLLNNERAMGLLHIVRLWIAFYEVHLSNRYKSLFRRDAAPPSTTNHTSFSTR